MIYQDEMKSPMGVLKIEADDTHLLSILFSDEKTDSKQPEINSNYITKECKKQLQEYFEGNRIEFDIPIRFRGTAFQNNVWNALLAIPFGQTSTYGKQAARIKNPKAVRAVGAANGKNKINIIVPCHRIIGADGALTGYGGGLERKKWLLIHEGVKALKNRQINLFTTKTEK